MRVCADTWPEGVSVHVYECVCMSVYAFVYIRVSVYRCECIICV